MGYTRQNSQWADTVDVILHASNAETADGNGTAIEVADRGCVRLKLDVTAASGTTPQLLVVVETSYDGSNEWRALDSFDIKTGVSSQRISAGGLDRFVRVRWDVSGTTPSFTFDVRGEVA